MTENIPYHEQVDIKNIKKLRELLSNMPPFCADFFRYFQRQASTTSCVAYAKDILVFFKYIKNRNPLLEDVAIQEITLDFLDQLDVDDFEEYTEYLRCYTTDGSKEHKNTYMGINRKIAALKTFYNYFYQNKKLNNNQASFLRLSRRKEREIIRLDTDEIALLLDEVESGESLNPRQKKFHALTKTRDLAILTLMLGTGIRVSECVGLNLTDIDFRNGGIRIHRKGNKEVTVYFGDEVEAALKGYLVTRKKITPQPGHENAFFLSLQRRRMGITSVENLVKKYATIITPLKNITPHKLRSTYGTSLYQETGDIYLVADVLGHNDVNTTKRHYAAIKEERRRLARDKVKLREP